MSNDSNNQETFKLLRDRIEVLERLAQKHDIEEIDERLATVEDTIPQERKDRGDAEILGAGDSPDIRPSPDHDFSIQGEVIPFDIEHCVMKVDASGIAATVIVRPTDEKGSQYSSAADVEVFVANDRNQQPLDDRGWKKQSNVTVDGQAIFGNPESTVTISSGTFTPAMVGQWIQYNTSGTAYEIITFTDETHIDVTGDASSETNNDLIIISGDILSFMRFAPTVNGVGGVLVGERWSNDPAGSIVPYAGNTVPAGYLVCDGASLLRAEYPGLFTAIGTLWGTADGTHFNIPDFQRRFLQGESNDGTGNTPIGVKAGSERIDVEHLHQVVDTEGADINYDGNIQNFWYALEEADRRTREVNGDWTGVVNVPEMDRPDLAGDLEGSFDNRPPYAVVKFIIKT